jgi:hypothetical protein
MSPVIEGTTELKTAVGEYDFAVDGGAVSTIVLRTSTSLPNRIPIGSIIVSGWIEVDTLLAAGAGGTVALTLESAGDLQAAAIFSGAPWSTTGRKSIVPVGTGAATVKTTAERSISAAIAVNAVTAGKFRCVVLYR